MECFVLLYVFVYGYICSCVECACTCLCESGEARGQFWVLWPQEWPHCILTILFSGTQGSLISLAGQ